MKEEGFDTDAALDAAIKKLEADLKRTRKKEVDGDDMEVRSSSAIFCCYGCLNTSPG